MIRGARVVWRGSGGAGNGNVSSDSGVLVNTPYSFATRRFRRVAAGLAASLALGALSAHAAPTPFPADFRSSQVVSADATINVRVGGHGRAVVLIHGFGDTGDMWSPMAAEIGR